jgi:hypothetical protein
MVMRVMVLSLTLLLIGCGLPGAAVPTPVVQMVEVTRIVEVVVTATRTPTVTRRPATPTPRATRTPTPPPLGGKWKVTTRTSSFDDSPQVVLALDAESTIEGFLRSRRPTLILRCREQDLDVYVVTGMPADVERRNLDGATVRIRFDDRDAESQNTNRSTDDEALFFYDERQLINRLVNADRLLFGFTPFNASPVETSFDLSGLSDVLPQLLEACGE